MSIHFLFDPLLSIPSNKRRNYPKKTRGWTYSVGIVSEYWMAPGGALFYALLLLTFTLASFQQRQQPRTQLGHAQSRRPITRGLLFTCIVLVVDTELVCLRLWIGVSSCVYVWMFVRVYTWRRTVVGVCRICCCCVSGCTLWEFLGLPLLFVYVGLVYVCYGWLPPYFPVSFHRYDDNHAVASCNTVAPFSLPPAERIVWERRMAVAKWREVQFGNG